MGEETPERIAVIGSPGAGKSTLALVIARATGLPLIHLDREYWQPGWVASDAAEWHGRSGGLAAGERWVMDGNYANSLDARLRRATLVVWLDLPTRVCLTGAVRRAARLRGRDRPDMREGCPERLNTAFLTFLGYILTFRRRKRPAVERTIAASGVAVVRLCSVAARARFMHAVASGGLAAARAWRG